MVSRKNLLRRFFLDKTYPRKFLSAKNRENAIFRGFVRRRRKITALKAAISRISRKSYTRVLSGLCRAAKFRWKSEIPRLRREWAFPREIPSARDPLRRADRSLRPGFRRCSLNFATARTPEGVLALARNSAPAPVLGQRRCGPSRKAARVGQNRATLREHPLGCSRKVARFWPTGDCLALAIGARQRRSLATSQVSTSKGQIFILKI